MDMLSLNNKIFKNFCSRNKLCSSHSSKKFSNSTTNKKLFPSTTNNKKNIISSDMNKSTDIYSHNNNITTNNNKNKYIRLNSYKIRKFLNLSSYNKGRKYIKFDSEIESHNKSRNKMKFTKLFFSKSTQNLNSQNKTGLKNECEKICVLPNYFKVKNFGLKSSKIIKYFNLNKDNKFFYIDKNIPKYYHVKVFSGIEKTKNLLKRNGSFTPINRLKRLEDIYPTIFNIEGKKEWKLLNEIDNENKRRKKNETISRFIKKYNDTLKKKMILEKNKTIDENYKNKVSNFSYKRQLLLSTTKISKRDLIHLKRKNSFTFHLELPLYNQFLNLY